MVSQLIQFEKVYVILKRDSGGLEWLTSNMVWVNVI